MSPFDLLPDEMIHKIFDLLPQGDRSELASVNRRIFRLARNRKRLIRVRIHSEGEESIPCARTIPGRNEFIDCVRVLNRDRVETINTLVSSFDYCSTFKDPCKHDESSNLMHLDDEAFMLQINELIICSSYAASVSVADVLQIISTFNLKNLRKITMSLHMELLGENRFPCFLPENQIEEIILEVYWSHNDEDKLRDSNTLNIFACDCFAIMGCKTIVAGSSELECMGELNEDWFWLCKPIIDNPFLIVDYSKSGRAEDLMEKYHHYDRSDFLPKFIYELNVAKDGKIMLYDCRVPMEPPWSNSSGSELSESEDDL